MPPTQPTPPPQSPLPPQLQPEPHPLLPSHPSHPEHHHHRLLISVIVGSTAAIAALGYFYWNYFPTTLVSQTGYSGKLYLSLAPEGSQTADAYTLDLASGDIRLLRDDMYYKLTPTISRDGTQIAFVGRFKTDPTNDRNVFVANLDGSDQFQITFAEHYLERLPVWSPDGHTLAFTASAVPEPKTLDDWNIYAVDDKTDAEIKVSSGAWPQWLPDGRLIGMRADGIYLFDLKNKTVDKVWHFDIQADIGMKLVLSPDGKQLAWLVPSAQEVYLFAVNSGPTLTPVKVIPSQSLWGGFSPDSSYLMLQEVTYDATGVTANSLALYDIHANTKEPFLDITDWNHELVFLSDWR